jgi:hypothetical protein
MVIPPPMSAASKKPLAKSALPSKGKVALRRASAKDLRSSKIQLVKPWARKSLEEILQALALAGAAYVKPPRQS